MNLLKNYRAYREKQKIKEKESEINDAVNSIIRIITHESKLDIRTLDEQIMIFEDVSSLFNTHLKNKESHARHELSLIEKFNNK